MAGGLPRTNAAMRFVVKSWVTATCCCDALNFATRLLKYGMTSGLVSSNTILVVDPPDEEEHPATRPGPAIAAAPRPSAFIIDRRLSTGPSPRPPGAPGNSETPGPPPGAVGAAVRWFRPDCGSLSRCMAVLPPKAQITDPESGSKNCMPSVLMANLARSPTLTGLPGSTRATPSPDSVTASS